jgi:hypothetical protein
MYVYVQVYLYYTPIHSEETKTRGEKKSENCLKNQKLSKQALAFKKLFPSKQDTASCNFISFPSPFLLNHEFSLFEIQTKGLQAASSGVNVGISYSGFNPGIESCNPGMGSAILSKAS